MIVLPPERLDRVLKRFELLEAQMAAGPSAEEYVKLASEYAELRDMAAKVRELKSAEAEAEGLEALIADKANDPDMIALAEAEKPELDAQIEALRRDVQILLLPRDAADERSAILEIRAGTGGDEAALFAGDLYRMYERYAALQGWKTELVSASDGEMGGYKEIIATISGRGVFSRLKFESGVHRVQRVPATEAQGRIHTSTATVAVMPETEEVDVVIDSKDLKIDVMRSGGPGGQSVNTTDSAVRVHHIPSGLIVHCQQEKSQHKNKAMAMKLLRSKLYAIELEKQETAERDARRSQIGSGDRSEKIRTYNFPQDRLTDHRIGYTRHNLPGIMDGDLEDVISSLRAHFQAEALRGDEPGDNP